MQYIEEGIPMIILKSLCNKFVEKASVRIDRRFCTWPNVVTLLGFMFVGMYVFQFVTGNYEIYIPLTVLAIGVSDFLDGFLARWLNQHTFVGVLLDTSRDRLFRLTFCVHMFLVRQDDIIVVLLAVWVLHDITLVVRDGVRYRTATLGRTPAVNKIGQMFVMLVIGFIMIQQYWLAAPFISSSMLLWGIALLALGNRAWFWSKAS